MSKESALQFLNTLGTNERAKELLNNRKKPENFEKTLRNWQRSIPKSPLNSESRSRPRTSNLLLKK